MEELVSDHSDILSEESATQEKRSVRTKFKFSEDAITAREQLADHWEMTQKDVAEVVAKIADRFLTDDRREDFVENACNRRGELTRKTHVVSKATRDFLGQTAKELNLTRDQFFDAALRLAHTMVQQKRKRQIEDHKDLLPDLRDLRDRAEEVYSKVAERIEEKDPLSNVPLFGRINHLENIVGALEEEIKKGKPLKSDYDFWDIPSKSDFVEVLPNMNQNDLDTSDQNLKAPNLLRPEPESPPDLTHTKILEAECGGVKVKNPNWNKLLKIAHERVLHKPTSFQEIKEITNSNIKEGRFEERGYRHHVTSESQIPNFSLQGKKARAAWVDVLNLAKNFDIDVFVRFKWRDKKEAVHPDKVGILQLESTSEGK